MNYGAIGAIDRPRDQPQLRRPGRAVRRRRAGSQNWWTPDDFAHFKAVGAALAAQYDAYRPFPDLARQRQADAEREHRRRRRPRRRLRRLPALVGGKAGADRPAAHRRPAVLPQLRPELAEQDPRAGAAPADPDRRPRAGPSTAPTPCATSTPGTTRSTSSPGRRSTSRRTTACASGNPTPRRSL